MIPATLPARCWCSRSQSIVRGCLFHGGDLELRVDRLMRALRVIDTAADNELAGARKWLAFVCASIAWHLLPRSNAPAVGFAEARRLGDLDIIVTPDIWTARQAITAEELADLHAECVMGRWPWGAS